MSFFLGAVVIGGILAVCLIGAAVPFVAAWRAEKKRQ